MCTTILTDEYLGAINLFKPEFSTRLRNKNIYGDKIL